METYRKLLSNHGPNLKDFTHKLALGLIESSSDPYFQNVIFSQTNNYEGTQVEFNIPRDSLTLKRCLESCTWPKRFKLNHFSTDPTFVEICLTSNGEFQTKFDLLRTTTTRKKAHCALCLDAQTRYGCSICNIMLCHVPRNDVAGRRNCFTIWHSEKDLVSEQQLILQENPNKH